MTIGELIFQYRTNHKISQRQFALKCGLSNGFISMLEKNLNPKTGQPLTPSLPACLKLSSAMGITLTELFLLVDDMCISLTDDATSSTVLSLNDTDKNLLRMAGRDGSYTEKQLTDEQAQMVKMLIDQLPDASEEI